MNNNGVPLTEIVEKLASFVVGPFGGSVIILAVAGSFLGAALHLLPPRTGFLSLICGALAFSAAWLVRTFLGTA